MIKVKGLQSMVGKKHAITMIGFGVLLIIILAFVKSDIDTKDTFLCTAMAHEDMDMSTCPVHTSNSSWLMTFAFGVAFLIIGVGVHMLFPKNQQKQEHIFTIDKSKLSEEERKVHDLLQQKDGSMYQSDLIKETGFSKVQMTRVLDKMEHNHLIDRKRRGMTNIVVLK